MRTRRAMTLAALFTLRLSVASACADDLSLRNAAKELLGSVEVAPAEAVRSPIVELGRALFWDKRLSGDGKTACASCHLPADHGADKRTFSPDARGRTTKRNSQTVFNATLQPTLRWTGNRKSGAEQAEKSLTGSMGLASTSAAEQLLQRLGYEAAFRQAFPDDAKPLSTANYGRAIESYESTLTTPAAFDRFLAGDDSALTVEQQAGLRTFIQIGCVNCHSGALLGGNSMEKFGAVKAYWTATRSKQVDLGRFDDTGNYEDKHVFRVAMLRNIAKTGPYFHDGSVNSLARAVQIMADVQLDVRLSQGDLAQIVKFLDSLTGKVPAHFSAPASK